jgi:hypothetical protein
MITALDFEIDTFARLVTQRLRDDPGYRAIQTIPGVGPLLAAVLVAEIGDITRFTRPEQLASWAGLTPKHHESDTTVHRGRIINRAPRWSSWLRSRRCNASVPTPGWAESGTGSRSGAAATSASSPPPAS